MAPKRGGVRGTPAPEALESDSRGACAPLETFSNSLRHHISHHAVLRRTNNRTRLRIAHRSSSSTHHITDARRSMHAALAHRMRVRHHKQDTAARARPTKRHGTGHGGFLAPGHQDGGRAAQQPRKAKDWGQRSPGIRTWTQDDTAPSRRPC